MEQRQKLEQIRTIGFIAHIDAGKTTTTEEVLNLCGVTHKIGRVDDGTTITDYMPQERERGITITAAAISCMWKDWILNIIDTPGHVDFTAEVERSLRVLDGAIVVFDAVAGVQPQSETVWRQANRYGVPRICFINKMDRQGANFERALKTIEQRLHAKPIALQIPIGAEEEFKGVIDLIWQKAFFFSEDGRETNEEVSIPQEFLPQFHSFRTLLIEKLAEHDDEILELYLNEKEITPEDIVRSLRIVTLKGLLFPALCGSSLKHKGITQLLDAIGFYLPSPLDLPPAQGTHPKTGEILLRETKENAPLSALAFKVVTDPFVGRLVYLRVYSGTMKSGGKVLNSTKNSSERAGRILRMRAQQGEELSEIGAGHIGAAVGLKNTFTGDTICSEDAPILLEKIRFPEPVFSVSIEAKTRADQDKLNDALLKLTEEDPTLILKYDKETGQNILSGMGELHLEIITDRLKREFHVEGSVGRPKVSYRETITAFARAEGRFIRQSGGHGQYGHVWLELEPLEPGKGFIFENRIVGGAIPKEYISAVEKGVRESLGNGVLAGYQVVDLKVSVVDGSYHDVDSSEIAFKLAAQLAMKTGLLRASPILLEPIMDMEVVTPSEFLGDVLGDVSGRRGRIQNLEDQNKAQVIRALVPLAEMFGYATSIRSLTQGRASYSMEFSKFEKIPESVATEILKDAKR